MAGQAAKQERPDVPPVPSEPEEVEDDLFRPGKPGFLSGHVVGRDDGKVTSRGTTYTELLIDDGLVAEPVVVPVWHAELIKLVARENPQPGDGFSLRCFGELPGRYGFQFALAVTKPEAESK